MPSFLFSFLSHPLFLSLISFSLILSTLSPFHLPALSSHQSSLSLSLPFSLLSHYRSLVSWPGLVLTVLVSIRGFLLGVGLSVSDLTKLRFVHISLHSPYGIFLQNVSAPDVEFRL